MTEEHYKKIRNNNLHNPLQILYIYYEEEKNEHVEPSYFTHAFSSWVKKETTESLHFIVNYLVHYLDIKFNTSIVRDIKTNKILYIY